MLRNVWWLAAGLMVVALAGVVRAESEKEDCCADKCPKPCPAAAYKVVKTADCTCEGKKDNCKCDACKCEKKPKAKCACEGKDKENCSCDKCKCMKKVEKILRAGKGGVLLMLWKVASPEKVAACCEATARHNNTVEIISEEEGCLVGGCPTRGLKREIMMSPPRVVMPPPMVHVMPPAMPLFPPPAPPIAVGPFTMPLPPPPPPMMPPVPAARTQVMLPAPSVVPCTAAVAAPPPVAPVSAMRFVAHDGQVKMEMTPHADSSVVSERLRMKVADGCTVQVSVADGQVELLCDCVTAKADSVVKMGKGERIILEGHVKFEYRKGEQVVEAAADRVVFDPTTGQFEIKTSVK